ncbi:hypothetical protein MTO96_044389 [Rhipicephalus appendiculatus]
MEKGLIALDDLEVTAGPCPARESKESSDSGDIFHLPANGDLLLNNFQIFAHSSLATTVPFIRVPGNFASWTLTTADIIGVPDHTIKTLKGQYLYVNTTGVDSHHPVSRVFMPVRPPTEATCVTFWWRGQGAPSQLNVYR